MTISELAIGGPRVCWVRGGRKSGWARDSGMRSVSGRGSGRRIGAERISETARRRASRGRGALERTSVTGSGALTLSSSGSFAGSGSCVGSGSREAQGSGSPQRS